VLTARREGAGADMWKPGDARPAGSGGLDDAVRADAAGADADAAHAAVDQSADALQVRLEAAGPHVVRVADRPAERGGLAADFTLFGHIGVQQTWEAVATTAPKNKSV